MKINFLYEGLLYKLSVLWRLFITPKKIWFPPRTCEILIYDGSSSELFISSLEGFEVGVMKLRGEELNIPSIILGLFSVFFWTGKLRTSYILSYTKLSRPKLILTFIDNDLNFYRLSRSVGIPTMFIQNGIRRKNMDVFGTLPRLYNSKRDFKVDFMFVFNDAVGELYRSYVEGETFIIGSFKNNSFLHDNRIDPGTLTLISEWRPLNATYFDLNGLPVNGSHFYQLENKLLPFLVRWSKNHNKSLIVSGSQVDDAQEERKYFDRLLGHSNYTFRPKVGTFDSYRSVLNSEIVVFIDSTLGYEALRRGKKVACFSCRSYTLDDGKVYSAECTKFGWPNNFPDVGPFWTNFYDEKRFEEILSYLDSSSEIELVATHKKYSDVLMGFDPGNSKFRQVINDVVTLPCRPQVSRDP